MKKILHFTIFLAFLSCFNQKYKKHKPSENIVFTDSACNKIFSFIDNNWCLNRQNSVYTVSKKFNQDFVLNHFDCIKTLTFDDIEKLLGASNYKDEISMFYYIGEYCNSPLKENCEILLFVKGENGKVNDISFQRADLLK